MIIGGRVTNNKKKHDFYTPEVQHSPWKMMVGRLLSYWEGLFLGAMLNFRGVIDGFFSDPCEVNAYSGAVHPLVHQHPISGKKVPGFSEFVLKMSGQIITTSAEVTLNGGLIRESRQNSLNSRLGIILICPEMLIFRLILWKTAPLPFIL